MATRYRLIDKDGKEAGTFDSAKAAADSARNLWPGVPQDEDRLGIGWDVEAIWPSQ